MKFSKFLLTTALTISLVNAKAVNGNIELEKRSTVNGESDVLNFIYQLGNSASNIFNNFSDIINNVSTDILNWFYSTANYYQATDNALTYMTSSENVTVSEESNYYFFDGPGTSKALVFYQGAKVDERAYAGIMHSLAENGLDCFLVKMPLRLAVFGKNKAKKIIQNHNGYDDWYMAGHSLGGSFAAMYAKDHTDVIDEIILLGSYTAVSLPSNLKLLSIVADNDGVLNWDNYHNSFSKVAGNYTEVNIEGGNHSQFGDYGFQQGDNPATISMEEQHQIIINSILNEVGLNNN
ncbi:hypothetical protein BCR32DRAFT_266147 [Anaeromyces robustus]|uniref:Alpha/beta hydrolase fold-5 domain-containing protein n=1 Tax=Anaeromyces robustus TaxID=1754192 RepID=A0A1Y1XH49_9FUNG|nr:hypothetical protein BCR32DRAFT_266147 [Anaeromyces robustus]|eukprot:ORX84704.1 hypothetical protein BCR32DRAFT_266147 [Anaeromyces robustus]